MRLFVGEGDVMKHAVKVDDRKKMGEVSGDGGEKENGVLSS